MVPNDILLLKLIRCNGRISMLLERGLLYSQIATIIQQLSDDELICMDNTVINLTKKGEEIIQEYNKSHSLDNQQILRNENRFFEPLSEKDILLPRMKDIKKDIR